jgi:ubiquinone biosynthesis protein COQ4
MVANSTQTLYSTSRERGYPMKKIYKYIKLMYVSILFVKDPKKLEEVLAIAGSIHDKKEMNAIIGHLETLPKPAAALKSRPSLGKINVLELAELPVGSLGYEYAEYLKRNGFAPDDIRVRSENEMAGTLEEYVINYFYNTHDLFHVVTGFETDVAGELGLQAFYCAKGPGNFTVFVMGLLLLNTFLFAQEEKDARLEAIANGWRLGRKSVNFFGIDWASMWARPLTQIRQELELGALPA